MAWRGCDAELRLGVGSSADSPRSSRHCDEAVQSATALHRPSVEGAPRSAAQHPQQITIFYNGRFCACDATEIQARAIISIAKREMERMHHHQDQEQQHWKESPPQAQPQLLNPGLSMKRSLQRFLQKREARISAAVAAPYNHRHRAPSSPS